MNRKSTVSAVITLGCTVLAGAGLVGCDEGSDKDSKASASSTAAGVEEKAGKGGGLTWTKKIPVDGHSVNVSCSGSASRKRPVIVLLSGGGDKLQKMADLQKTLSRNDRVCTYDRLGQGASDKPSGPQTFESSGKILTGVLDKVAGGRPVVLAGHSLGGIISARYAPDHRDKVKGLVLLDATSPTNAADIANDIPEDATGEAAQLREENLAVFQGENPEKIKITDGRVRSAGRIPVEVIKHGKPYLADVPEYGPALERSWTRGQHKWLAISSNSHLSTAAKSGHYIYLDQPDVAVKAVRRVVAKVAHEGPSRG